MAIESTHTRRLATAATLMQLLWSHCQPDASPGKQPGTPPSAGSPERAAAAASAGSGMLSTPAAAAPSSSASVAVPRTSGSAGMSAAAASSNTAAISGTMTAPSNVASQAGASGSATPATPASAAQAGAPAMPSSSLPALTDFKAAGPFTPKRDAGPSGYVLFYPQELGKDGVKHPILSWGPGAAETASDFGVMLNHIASHGFVVISFDGTPQGQELVTGIDWLLAENMKEGGMFYQKLDATKISAGGHSAGSLATFVIGGDARLVTTMHISGGTFDPHTDIKNLHAPALFVCGEPGGDGLLQGDVANPNCQIDFDNANFRYGNIGASLHRGLLASVGLPLDSGWDLRLDGAVTPTTLRGGPNDGNQINAVPVAQGAMRFGWEPVAALRFEATARWVGRQWLDEENLHPLGEQGTVDLGASAAWSRLRLAVRVGNLFDRRMADTGYIGALGEERLVPAVGRNASVTLRYE